MDNPCRLKVLHIASGDLWAGAEVQLFTLAKTLQNKMGTTVSVILFNYGTLEQELRETGVQVIVLDESKLNGFQILSALIRAIRELNPDVVHTHRLKENILGSIAARLSGNIPSLRTVHGAPEFRPVWQQLPTRLILFLDWFCGRFIQQLVVAVSQDLASILQNDFPSNHIRVIENGIDVDAIGKENKEKRGSTEIGQRTFRIGLAGRLVPVKRVDLFIETAQYILEHYPKLKTSFHVFGDGAMREDLIQLSEDLKVSDFVHFEGHCNDIAQKLQGLDALLMTSDHEGLPMILLECMALQTPIVAHAVGGIPNLLDHGSCGILVTEHNALKYALAIYQLATDPAKRSEITHNAIYRVIEKYSAKINAQKYCAQYLLIRKQITIRKPLK